MDFDKVLTNRQSCRKYDPNKKVEKEKLDKIISNAMLAPSACNSQPYSFIVVNGPLSQEVAKCAQKFGSNRFTSDCPSFIVITEEKANLPQRVGSLVQDNKFAEIDIGIVTSFILLSATSLGLSTCTLGLFGEQKLKELLNIDKNKRVRLVIAVGYADENDPLRNKIRKDVKQIYKYVD